MSNRITIGIPFALECVQPSRKLQQHVYNGVELLRVAAARLAEMEREAEDDDPDGIDFHFLMAARVNCQLYVRILQETFGGVLPTIPDRVLTTLRSYADRWPENYPGAEGTVLTLRLAWRAFQAAIGLSADTNGNKGDDIDDLDEVLIAAADIAASYATFLDGGLAAFNDARALQAILDGDELPPFRTEADVEMARTLWKKEGLIADVVV